jgi:hypothetical protein
MKKETRKRWKRKNIINFLIIYLGIMLFFIVKNLFFTSSGSHSAYPAKSLSWSELMLVLPRYSLYAFVFSLIINEIMSTLR